MLQYLATCCHMLPKIRTGHVAIAESKYLHYKNFRVVVFREKHIDYIGNHNYIMQETQINLLVRVDCYRTPMTIIYLAPSNPALFD